MPGWRNLLLLLRLRLLTEISIRDLPRTGASVTSGAIRFVFITCCRSLGAGADQPYRHQRRASHKWIVADVSTTMIHCQDTPDAIPLNPLWHKLRPILMDFHQQLPDDIYERTVRQLIAVRYAGIPQIRSIRLYSTKTR